MNILALIPARGGSKGIPGKNLANLAGKPLIGWTIEAARNARLVDGVVVSTDDEQIANCARAFGAKVVMRPAELSGDQSSSESALLHALEQLDTKENIRPEITVFLQCTSPLTEPEDIDGTIDLVRSGGYDSAFSAAPFHGFVWRKDDEGFVIGANHDHSKREMRQKREKQFLENGAVYAIKTEALRKSGYRFYGKVGIYETPVSRSLEIDEPEDMARAELIMRHRPEVNDALEYPIREKLSLIKLVITDFDGVLTDNRVYLNDKGEESVRCNRGDGWGVNLLRDENVPVVCLSTEKNPVVRKRCEKMRIECHSGQDNKLSCFNRILAEKGIDPENCLYIGNDTNDSACLRAAGIAVVPRDAALEVKPLAQIQTIAAGGEGVLREIASLIIKVRNERQK